LFSFLAIHFLSPEHVEKCGTSCMSKQKVEENRRRKREPERKEEEKRY